MAIILTIMKEVKQKICIESEPIEVMLNNSEGATCEFMSIKSNIGRKTYLKYLKPVRNSSTLFFNGCLLNNNLGSIFMNALV
jgi:hypothetical protein